MDEPDSDIDNKKNEKPQLDEAKKSDPQPDKVIKPPDNSAVIETIIISDENPDSSDKELKSLPESERNKMGDASDGGHSTHRTCFDRIGDRWAENRGV